MSQAWLRLLLLGATVALITLEAAANLAWGVVPVFAWVAELSIALVWSVVGAVAWWRRPRSRIGLLMMIFGLVVAANATSPLHSSSAAAAVLITIGGFAFGVLPAPGFHTVMAYPSGRIPDRLSRGFVAVTYAWGLIDGTRIVLVSNYGRGRPGPWAQSLLRVSADLEATRPLAGALVSGWLLIGVGMVVLLVRRGVGRAGGSGGCWRSRTPPWASRPRCTCCGKGRSSVARS
jgi:hypothetical protein